MTAAAAPILPHCCVLTLPVLLLQGWKIPPHLPYAGRGPSASPAAGFASVHAEEQKALVDDALNLVRFSPFSVHRSNERSRPCV